MPPATHVLLSLHADELSTVIQAPGGQSRSLDGIASDIAFGASDYSSLINDLRYHSLPYSFAPVDYNAIAAPPPAAYYLGFNLPPGCNEDGPHPECSTIFDGAYKPGLKVPRQLRSLAAGFEQCVDALHGLYDPPHPLNPAASANGVSLTAGTQPTTTVPASPCSTPGPPTPAPTATQTVTTTGRVSSSAVGGSGTSQLSADDVTDPALSTDQSTTASTTPEDTTSIASAELSSTGPAPGGSSGQTITDTAPSQQTSLPPSTIGNSPSNPAPPGGTERAGSSSPISDARDSSTLSDRAGVKQSSSPSSSPNPDGPAEVTTTIALSALQSALKSQQSSVLVDPFAFSAIASEYSGAATSADPTMRGSAATVSMTSPRADQLVTTVGGATYTIEQSDVSDAAIVNGETIAADAPEQTLNGQVISAASGGIVVGSQTIAYPATSDSVMVGEDDSAAIATITLGTSLAVVASLASANGVVIDSHTLSAGGPAQTIDSELVSLASDSIVVGSHIVPLDGADTVGTGSQHPALLTVGGWSIA
ncbi:hypothetical protein LTR85_006140 [Meristemomyces frigidus]|nr:hypothetical protein LTR85_006140 [Meristemomyces frigidus]